MLNSSEKFALILIPPFLVVLSNFYEKKVCKESNQVPYAYSL